MNNNKNKVIEVSYTREAVKDVEKMMVLDTFAFFICIKRICQQRNLDPYNMEHLYVAIEILKMQVANN